MTYQKSGISDKHYVVDTITDLEKIPKCSMGSTAYVIDTATTYMVNSKGKWFNQDIEKPPIVIDEIIESEESGGYNEIIFSNGDKIQIKNGIDGTNGSNGQDGYTPQKGTDYWTPEDINEMENYMKDYIIGGKW